MQTFLKNMKQFPREFPPPFEWKVEFQVLFQKYNNIKNSQASEKQVL